MAAKKPSRLTNTWRMYGDAADVATYREEDYVDEDARTPGCRGGRGGRRGRGQQDVEDVGDVGDVADVDSRTSRTWGA